MISRSAPRPVMAPPTPAAKYSPPLLVSQRPADLESALRVTLGKMALYSSVSIRFLTLRPKRMDNSDVWVVCMIFMLGLSPMIQEGKYTEANSLLVCLGGMLTIRRLISPLAISVNLSAKTLWWSPRINSGQI